MDTISNLILELDDELIALRRDFHQNPELGLNEFRTSRIVTNYLEQQGITCGSCNGNGVSGLLEGNPNGPTLLLRADMDALPVQEETSLPFSSKIDGAMHACGHDAHTAMLLIAAKILSSKRKEIYGNIRFAFEPNEENAGALGMIKEGLLDNPPVNACLAVHVWNQLDSGIIGLKDGPVMAGMKHFSLKIIGKGGHTAAPHTAIDPILTASAIIQGIQSIQTRETDTLNEPLVIVFGTISGGTADNVIPETVTLSGTIRTLSSIPEEHPDNPMNRFTQVVSGICSTHRTSFDLKFTEGHPTLINDQQMVEILTTQIEKLPHGTQKIIPFGTLAGEDFSEFTTRVPGVFYFLGAGIKEKENFPHHHPKFDIDEKVLKYGVELHVRTALSFCKNVKPSA